MRERQLWTSKLARSLWQKNTELPAVSILTPFPRLPELLLRGLQKRLGPEQRAWPRSQRQHHSLSAPLLAHHLALGFGATAIGFLFELFAPCLTARLSFASQAAKW